MDQLDYYSVVATGLLHKQMLDRGGAFTERKVFLSGNYLYQFTKNDVYKGKFDVSGCTLKIVDRHVPQGYYGFRIEGAGRAVLFCTPSVGTLFAWLNALSEQIADYMDDFRVFLKRGEAAVANAFAWVQRDTAGGERERVRVLVTNLPRMLLLEATGPLDPDSDESPTYAVREQIAWTKAAHPAVKHVSPRC